MLFTLFCSSVALYSLGVISFSRGGRIEKSLAMVFALFVFAFVWAKMAHHYPLLLLVGSALLSLWLATSWTTKNRGNSVIKVLLWIQVILHAVVILNILVP